MDNYQPEINIPLEEMNRMLLGRTILDMGVIGHSASGHGVPLSFYSEQHGDSARFFIGRDYRRIEPSGQTDYRIELLERLVENNESERVGNMFWRSGRVETAPLFRVWEQNLTPPSRERRVCDFQEPQNGLNFLTMAYVVFQNQEDQIPAHIQTHLRTHSRY